MHIKTKISTLIFIFIFIVILLIRTVNNYSTYLDSPTVLGEYLNYSTVIKIVFFIIVFLIGIFALDIGDFYNKKSRTTMQVILIFFFALVIVDIILLSIYLIESKGYNSSSILISILLNIIIMLIVNVSILGTLKRIRNIKD